MSPRPRPTFRSPSGRIDRFTKYLALQPRGARARLLLTEALLRAMVWRTFRRSRYLGPGQFLRRPIAVQSSGVMFRIRATSDDLEYAVPGHKPALEAWFRPSEGELVVDVGAGIGFYSFKAARAGANVIAIEANADTCAALRTNISLNPRMGSVRVLGCAIGSRPGAGELRVPQLASGFSSLRSDWVDEAQAAPTSPMLHLSVQVRTLDDALSGLSASSVDWLLVDVEGMESEVLEGGSGTLRSTKRIVIEVDASHSGRSVAEALDAAGLETIGKIRQSPRTEYWFATRRGA
jgi:FkbM family methyltransferase